MLLGRKRSFYRAACLLLMFTAAFFFSLSGKMVEAEMQLYPQRQTVRVGFYQMAGYHMMTKEGTRYGYGYDYLHLIDRFADFDYEYIGYNQGWKDMFELLDRGVIDIMTGVQKTPERAAKYIYSEKPMAYSSMLMTTLESNTRYQPYNPSTYDGMRVGLLSGNMRSMEFARFAGDHNFSYTPVYYDSVSKEEAALHAGEVDAIVTSNKRKLQEDEKILELTNPQPLYVISTADKQAIVQAVDHAQQKLSVIDPGWEVALSKRYYGEGGIMALTPESQSFLRELQASDRVFRVVVMPHANPYSYFDRDGQARGILPDTFKLMADTIGLKYEIIPAANQAEYEKLLRDEQTDIVLGMSSSAYEAEKVGYKLSKAILRASIVQISMKNESMEGTVGMTANLKRKLAMLGQLPENVVEQDYDTAEEAVAALKSGRCSSIYTLGLIGEKYVNEDKHNSLRITIVPNRSMSMRLGIRSSLDHRLMEVLSAAMPDMDSVEMQDIMHRYTDVQPQSLSWEEMLYSYPLQFILLAILLAMLAGLGLVTVIRNNALRQDEKRRQEIDVVMSYICRLNEMVVKVDLKNHTATEYHIDEEGHVFVDMLPHTIERYVGYLHPEDRLKFMPDGEWYKEMHEAFAQKRSYYCEVRKQDGPDSYRFFSAQFQPYYEGGELAGFYFYRQDIDDLRRKDIAQREALKDALETARHASAAKGDFLSRMSHEIRTPLNAIIGYLTLGEQKDNNERDLRQLIGKSQIAAHHLLGLINDILDLSSIEQGKMKLANEEFSLQDIVTEMQTIFNGQLEQKKLDFVIDVKQMPHSHVIGDAMRVKQVLMNIFSNAVKFTPEEGKIEFIIRQVLHPGNVVMTTFEITDTGIGMSQEYLKNIFKPFEQENAKVAHKHGGSGLGLAITQNLVKMMQGSIEVRSIQNVGTSFYISLPLQVGADIPVETEEKEQKEVSLTGMRLLLVEDNEMNREISETILAQYGFVIDTAVDGQDAVDKFLATEPGTYKAILMDVQMPVLDGYGATQAIRRSGRADGENIPIIAVTADVFTDDVARVMACGMNDYLSKPIDFDKLLEKLRKYV